MEKLLIIRRSGECVRCHAHLPVGTTAYWSTTARVVTCTDCHGRQSTDVQPVAPPVDDQAGASARAEYARRSARERTRHEHRVTQDAEWRRSVTERHPVVGRVVTALTAKPVVGPESQTTRAWKVGAEGEERVAELLAAVGGIEVLHDRRIPGTRANIDHVVVGHAGMFVVDAKKYAGSVERRHRGGWFSTDERLFVNGRDQTKLVEGVLRQVDVVRKALGEDFADVPIRGVLCFVGSTWGLLPRPKIINGVTALWPAALAQHVGSHGPHASVVAPIAALLRDRLRPATH